MIWKQRTNNVLEEVSKTGFLVSVSSYMFFWVMDAVKPGFVSRYISVHIFLLAAILFGVLWGRTMKVYTEHRAFHWVAVSGLGLLLAVVTWHVMHEYEGYRLLLTALSFPLPALIYKLID